jgi:hypothetical protein
MVTIGRSIEKPCRSGNRNDRHVDASRAEGAPDMNQSVMNKTYLIVVTAMLAALVA